MLCVCVWVFVWFCYSKIITMPMEHTHNHPSMKNANTNWDHKQTSFIQKSEAFEWGEGEGQWVYIQYIEITCKFMMPIKYKCKQINIHKHTYTCSMCIPAFVHTFWTMQHAQSTTTTTAILINQMQYINNIFCFQLFSRNLSSRNFILLLSNLSQFEYCLIL